MISNKGWKVDKVFTYKMGDEIGLEQRGTLLHNFNFYQKSCSDFIIISGKLLKGKRKIKFRPLRQKLYN